MVTLTDGHGFAVLNNINSLNLDHVNFYMFCETALLLEIFAALVAFEWLFTTVRFYMCPQRASIRAFIFTLVAFV